MRMGEESLKATCYSFFVADDSMENRQQLMEELAALLKEQEQSDSTAYLFSTSQREMTRYTQRRRRIQEICNLLEMAGTKNET